MFCHTRSPPVVLPDPSLRRFIAILALQCFANHITGHAAMGLVLLGRKISQRRWQTHPVRVHVPETEAGVAVTARLLEAEQGKRS